MLSQLLHFLFLRESEVTGRQADIWQDDRRDEKSYIEFPTVPTSQNIMCTAVLSNFITDQAKEAQLYSLYIQ
jgi:hypothetical protein